MRHVGVRALARYREGVLRAGKTARVTAHLATCPQCSGVHSGLEAVSRLLATPPSPPMPDAVADRIHAALAAEAATRPVPVSATAPPTAGRHGRTVRSARPSVFSPLMLRGLAAAASIAVVVGVGFLFATNALGPTASSSAPTAGSGRASPAHAGLPAFGPQRRLPYGTPQHTALALATGANYTPTNLESLVHRDLAKLAEFAISAPHTPEPSAAGATGLINGTSATRLAGCLADVDHGRQVLVADVARYLGRPATIIVLKPLLAAASFFDVVVVGPGCSSTTPDIITSIDVPAH